VKTIRGRYGQTRTQPLAHSPISASTGWWIGSRSRQGRSSAISSFFRGRTRQYVFISSASAYQKPSTPLLDYRIHSPRKSVLGLLAEQECLRGAFAARLAGGGFPDHHRPPIVDLNGESQIPLVVNSWAKSYTAIDRMRRGKKVIVPGDGSSLWVITHNSDFAKGLVGPAGP